VPHGLRNGPARANIQYTYRTRQVIADGFELDTRPAHQSSVQIPLGLSCPRFSLGERVRQIVIGESGIVVELLDLPKVQ
jgi:hypothetical protein